MALYAIGDLHLSLGTNKPMDVFGSSSRCRIFSLLTRCRGGRSS